MNTRPPRSPSPRGPLFPIALTALCLVYCGLGGCRRANHEPAGESSSSSAATSAGKAPKGGKGGNRPASRDRGTAENQLAASPSASEVLAQTLAAYRSAETYSDSGEVRLAYRQDGHLHRDVAPLQIALQRPDKISIHAYQLRLQCDGQQLVASIEDPASDNFDQQVVVRDSPSKLDLESIFQNDVSLQRALVSGLAGAPVPLELLLSEQALAMVVADEARPTLLEDRKLDGTNCYRIQATTELGKLVLWIDKTSFAVRQVEYPTGHIAGPESGLEDLELVAEFKNARLNEPVRSSRFKTKIPAGTKQVLRLVPPPAQLSSPLFGKKPDAFHFRSSQSGKVSQAELTGDIVVLVWFQDHPACRTALKQLERVRTQFQDQHVRFFAVATEGAQRSDEDLRGLLREWEVEVPLLRDHQSYGRDVFRISSLPCLVVLDEEGVLHTFDAGFHPQLTEELPLVLEMLLEGQDVAGSIRQRFALERANYQRELAAAGWESPDQGSSANVSTSPLPARTEPRQLQLTRVWSTDSLVQPGNLTILPPADTSRSTNATGPSSTSSPEVAVFSGLRSVALLAPDGSTRKLVELDLPAGRAASHLRPVRAADGERYFAAFEMMGRQVHVFDGEWQEVFQYPEADVHHEGIRDVVWSDLDGDGTPELAVGFWGEAGVHGLSLEGQRKWANRDCPLVQSLCTTQHGLPRLLVTGGTGRIHALTAAGKLDASEEVTDRPIVQLYQGLPQSATPWLGLSAGPQGRLVALGLDAQFRERWNYTLPDGNFRTPLDFVTHGSLWSDQPAWVVAGADGSLHCIAADGSFSDFFSYGTAITGLAVWSGEGQSPLLIVSTAESVDAWRLSNN